MQHDVILRVRLRTPQEGGRRSTLSGKHYGCPLIIENEAFDCRIFLGGRSLQLGTEYEVAAAFLNRALVLPKLFVGQTVQLWEGKVIGDGTILTINLKQ